MNKTVNINLGGLFFHIDEDAYQKLTRYFDAIRRSLSNSTGQEEIIKDIEMRIAELITERHTHDKQVINTREVDEIIAIMGQPEDYRIQDDEPEYTSTATRGVKKLYRDTEKGMLGGVCTGLGHYIGIDAVWIRIFFLILAFGFGTGFLAYIILWIAIPAAVTTAEKLEMTGEPVTISSIEKKVREEFENVTERFKGADYSRVGDQAKTGVERVASAIGSVFMAIFKVFAKIIGILLVAFSSFMLLLMLVGLFTLGSTSFIDVPWQGHLDTMNYTGVSFGFIAALAFLAVGIPMFSLFMLGLKIISSKIRSVGNIARYTLLAVWLISVGGLIALSVKQATEVAQEGKTVKKEILSLTPQDTLMVRFRYNDFYAKDIDHHDTFRFIQSENGREIIFSNNVVIEVLPTDEPSAYFTIEKCGKGRTLSEAKERAENIVYNYQIEGNKLVFDNYFLTEPENKFRGQKVKIFLYLPKGTLFKPDSSMQNFDDSSNYFFNLHFSGNYLYRVDENRVMCVDCPPDENDYGDVVGGNSDHPHGFKTKKVIIIDNNGVILKDSSRIEKKVKKIQFNDEGVLIKTE